MPSGLMEDVGADRQRGPCECAQHVCIHSEAELGPRYPCPHCACAGREQTGVQDRSGERFKLLGIIIKYLGSMDEL